MAYYSGPIGSILVLFRNNLAPPSVLPCPSSYSKPAVRTAGNRFLDTCSYNSTAITVADKDQTYDFVDVRDVVVLDPGVRCHPDCFLRRSIDARLQRGWEFSVQVNTAAIVVAKKDSHCYNGVLCLMTLVPSAGLGVRKMSRSVV